jgi:hypothetical protein
MLAVDSIEEVDTTEIKRTARPSDGWGPFRRRSMARVLVMSGFIVAVVWIVQYAGAVGDVARSYRIAAQHAPLTQLIDPVLIARAFPVGLSTVLTVVVGFFALLRLKGARPIERTVLRAMGQGAGSGEQGVASTEGERRRAGEGERGQDWRWVATGLAVVAVAISILEWMQSYYFVQDDNFANVLPGVLQGCRSMCHGEFPDFDPCQYLGMPNAGKGIFALFYPPTIVSYAIARWVLGNENWTLDVFAAMHLLAGYVASYIAARKAGLRSSLAFALAISFVLSGYILVVGRGWHAVLTLVFWLPVLFCAMEAWLNGRIGWKWLFASGLAIGGFYYMGFPQYWVYALFFLGLVAITAVACGRVAPWQLVWPAAAGLLGIAIVLPTLIVQFEITRGMEDKTVNFGMGFEQGLAATVAPFPFSHADGFMGVPANCDKDLTTESYYAGTILMAAGFVVLGVLLSYRCSRRWFAANPWVVAAVVSLWLGLGSAGLLWSQLGRLPVMKSVNHHPHRLLPFFVFFTLIIGGRFIEGMLRIRTRRRSGTDSRRGSGFQRAVEMTDWQAAPRGRKWEYAIAAATVVLMLYHVSLVRNSLWHYGDRPYPQLPPEIAQRVLPSGNAQAGRVLWYGPWRSGVAGYANLLPHSLPSAYVALAFAGYDPIIERRPETMAILEQFDRDPVATARAYGVRWVLAANPEHFRPERDFWQAVRKKDWCFDFMDEDSPSGEQRVISKSQLRVDRDDVRLYELSGASPLAFNKAKPDQPLSIRFCGWGAEVNATGEGERTVVVNMAMRPWVKAVAGGEDLQTAADAIGRVEVHLPADVTHFDVYYQLPWRRGLFFGGGLAAVTLLGMGLLRPRFLEAGRTERRILNASVTV